MLYTYTPHLRSNWYTLPPRVIWTLNTSVKTHTSSSASCQPAHAWSFRRPYDTTLAMLLSDTCTHHQTTFCTLECHGFLLLVRPYVSIISLSSYRSYTWSLFLNILTPAPVSITTSLSSDYWQLQVQWDLPCGLHLNSLCQDVRWPSLDPSYHRRHSQCCTYLRRSASHHRYHIHVA